MILYVLCVSGRPGRFHPLGQNNENYPILETYEEGSVMEVKTDVSAYHWAS